MPHKIRTYLRKAKPHSKNQDNIQDTLTNETSMVEIRENIRPYINYHQLHRRRMGVVEDILQKDFKKLQNILIANLVNS